MLWHIMKIYLQHGINDFVICLGYRRYVVKECFANYSFHRTQGTGATVAAVQPPGRFGAIDRDADKIRAFHEKPRGDGSWISGGFFVLEPEVVDVIPGDATVWEREPLETLSRRGQLSAFRHPGFWQAMDTLRDQNHLEALWTSGKAPWKVWA